MVEGTEISTAEWQIMNVVWERQPITARKVIELVATENQWSASTVRTFLHRLVKKGALIAQQDGNRYLYRAAISRSKSVKEASRAFHSSVFGGGTGPLLAHFVKTSKLSAEEIKQLRELLEEKSSK